jgi:hypothetical protein
MGQNFKKELEIACKIAQWNPSNKQLYKIAQYIKDNPDKIEHLGAYICEICDDVLFRSEEGIDNSDLNYLIALAIKTIKDQSK